MKLLLSAKLKRGSHFLVRTSFITVYDTAVSYNVTAGVGPFNGSLVRPFLSYVSSLSPEYPFKVIPYSYYAVVYNLVANSMFSTVAAPLGCHGERCAAYLLSGGVIMATPWIPAGNDSYPMVKLDMVPSMQLEFSGQRSLAFEDQDCESFGADDTRIGIRLCVAADSASAGTIQAGKMSPEYSWSIF